MLSVKAGDPAAVEAGDNAVIAGEGLLIVKLAAVEVPPPGAGLTTVTAAVPAVVTSAAVIAALSCVALT